jgi:hypothetical protein
MKMNEDRVNTDCFFYLNEYCKISGRYCRNICRGYTKKFEGLSFKDHLDLYNRKNDKTIDLLIRWITISIAFISVIVALISITYKKNNNIIIGCYPPPCIILSITYTPTFTPSFTPSPTLNPIIIPPTTVK